MATIKNVAIVGATGNVGPYVLRALLDAQFNVTALSRESSQAQVPEGVTLKKVNYHSLKSVAAALEGQDAVVSVLGSLAVASQRLIIDAAISAKVKRFIPSEFGVDTTSLENKPLKPLLAGKMAIIDYLKDKSSEHDWFSGTGIATGGFFEWGLNRKAFAIDIDDKSATIYDSGDKKFATSTLPFVGQLVAASLAQADKTADRYFAAASIFTSQNELLKVLKEEIDSQETWSVSHASAAELEAAGLERILKKDFTGVPDLMKAFTFKDNENHALSYQGSGNQLLGLPFSSLQDLVKQFLFN